MPGHFDSRPALAAKQAVQVPAAPGRRGGVVDPRFTRALRHAKVCVWPPATLGRLATAQPVDALQQQPLTVQLTDKMLSDCEWWSVDHGDFLGVAEMPALDAVVVWREGPGLLQLAGVVEGRVTVMLAWGPGVTLRDHEQALVAAVQRGEQVPAAYLGALAYWTLRGLTARVAGEVTVLPVEGGSEPVWWCADAAEVRTWSTGPVQ